MYIPEFQELLEGIKKKVVPRFNLNIDIDEEEDVDPYLGKMP